MVDKVDRLYLVLWATWTLARDQVKEKDGFCLVLTPEQLEVFRSNGYT